MRTRRGSDYWGSGDEGMIAQFEPGDIVRPVGVGAFIGVVRDVQPKLNKVMVAWGAGSVSQHDPDEVQLIPYDDDERTAKKMASEDVVIRTRRGSRIKDDFFFEAGDEVVPGDPNQFAGNPKVHGLDKPRGGGFSIMQNLQKDLAPEALKESEKGPFVSDEAGSDISEDDGDQNAPDGDMNKAPEVKEAADKGKGRFYIEFYKNGKRKRHYWPTVEEAEKVADKIFKETGILVGIEEDKKRKASDELRSRRAMYWMDRGRTYRLTKNEQGAGGATCPKCKGDMSKEPFTKSEKLYNCPGCGFKVPSGKVLTERKVEVEIEPDGTVEVEVEPVERDASCRRGRLAVEVPSNLSSMKLHQIAGLISEDWGRKVNFAAKPYLEAMFSLGDVKDNYGLDSGRSIVAYFLSNASSWRGDVAKAVKKELKKRIK